MSTPTEETRNKAELVGRKALVNSVSVVCKTAGFTTIENSSLETLVEILQSFLTELGRSSRTFSELSGRTKPIVSDVAMALIDMGYNIESLPGYSAKFKNTLPPFPQPAKAPHTSIPKILQAGLKMSHPPQIPDYMPTFPDVHTYIKTPASKQQMNDYQAVREKAATQKRDVETSLTRFIAKTGQSQTMFKDDTNTFAKSFPLIAVKVTPISYLAALLPKEDETDQDHQDKHKTEPKRKRAKLSESHSSIEGPDLPPDVSFIDESGLDMQDNPYMRPVKFAKSRKKNR